MLEIHHTVRNTFQSIYGHPTGSDTVDRPIDYVIKLITPDTYVIGPCAYIDAACSHETIFNITRETIFH